MEKNPKRAELIEAVKPLKRYFNDCDQSYSYAGLLMAADTYLNNQFQTGDSKGAFLDDAIASGVIVDEVMYDFDRRQAIEQFMLLPLRYAAQFAEIYMEGTDLTTWYMWVAVRGTGGSREGIAHDQHCLDSTTDTAHMGCEYSTNCPMRVTRELLLKDIISPDFSSLEYQIYDERRVIETLKDKVSAAICAGVLTRQDANTYFNNYDRLRASQNI